MKAIVYTTYGPPDVLQLTEIEKPVPKENEVLVKVFAASLNDWDWGLLRGDSLVIRLMNGIGKPKKTILGSDIAGRVEAIGKSVTRFKVGDEVYGDLSSDWGGFAEYVCARENFLEKKPPGMTFEQAAAIPQAAMLAVQGLIDIGNITNGQKILINGAGGGVGTFGVQIAKLYGAEVTGVDRSEKLDMMCSVGFDHVIDYTKEDFTRNKKQYDLILDTKTNRSVFAYPGTLTPGGKYVTVGGSMPHLFQTFVFGWLVSLIYKKKIRIVALKQNKDLLYMNDLFEKGKLKFIIDGPFSLEEVPNAFRLFGEGKHKGKIVVNIFKNERIFN